MITSPALFAALSGTAIQISDTEVLFMAHLSAFERANSVDHRHVMTLDVYSAFSECREFATLDEHKAHLFKLFPTIDLANIERVLNNLCQRGLMQSEITLRARLSNAPIPASVPLSGMAIISAGHPASLEALLASAADIAPMRDRSFALFDLSEDTEHRARKVELMAEFGRRTGQRVILLDQKRERWLSERVQQMPEHVQGLNLLFGKAAGARARALNTIAVAYVGERVLVVDDSVRLRTYGPEGGAIQLAERPQRRAQVYPSIESAFAAMPRGPNLWQLAEHALGQGLRQLLDGVSVRGQRLEAFDGYEHARVARLGLGVLGSSDTAHSFWGFTLDADGQAALKTHDEVQFALAGDTALLCPSHATLAPSLGTNASALDLSGAHGFAFGDDDGSDRTLASFSQFCDPGAMELSLPIALERRAPPAPRASVNRQPLQLSAARFIAEHVNQLQALCFAIEPSARWRWLAIQCLDLAEASHVEREQIVTRYTTAKRAELLSELQQFLIHAGASEPWRHELLSVIQAQAEGMMHADGADLTGFARETSPADALSLQLRHVAAAALAWAALWENARECRLN
jgi:hypothetical protein